MDFFCWGLWFLVYIIYLLSAVLTFKSLFAKLFSSFLVLFVTSPHCLSMWTWPLSPTRCPPSGSSGMSNSAEEQWGFSLPPMEDRLVCRKCVSSAERNDMSLKKPNNKIIISDWFPLKLECKHNLTLWSLSPPDNVSAKCCLWERVQKRLAKNCCGT